MTEERALELLAAYGADPMRWPAAERTAAQALLAVTESPRLQAALAEAEALDQALDGLSAPVLSEAARQRLTCEARPGLRGKLRGFLGWQGSLWRPAGALAAALLLGVALGMNDTAVETIALPGASLTGAVEQGPDPDDGDGAFLDGGLL